MPTLDGVYRREWGPAVAALARWSGDLSVAEDAVQEAFAEALRAWPRDGVPANPGGWIVTVARNRALDRFRRESTRPGRELAAVTDQSRARMDDEPLQPVRDDELRMMFTCAHPALDGSSQLALTLRLISGLTVAEIARALMQPEATVGQRITRAKDKIRTANIPLRVPAAELLTERVPHVLGCIYSVFTEGYWSTAGPSAIRDELCDEGVRLAGEMCALMPRERDADALAALVLLHDSRRRTRVDDGGALVPLDEQDRSLWNADFIAEGVALISATLGRGPVGPYQLQAAIAALHDEAATAAETDWPQILALYEVLEKVMPGPVVTLNKAVALGRARGPLAGLAALGELEGDERMAGNHRVEAVRAHLLELAGDRAAAHSAYLRAARMTASVPEQRYLTMRAALTGSEH